MEDNNNTLIEWKVHSVDAIFILNGHLFIAHLKRQYKYFYQFFTVVL